MSVIHEAIKRARAAKTAPPVPSPGDKPAVTVKTARQAPAWLWWLMLFFVLAEGALFLSERSRRLGAEEKMRQAYLQMNDARGEYLEKSVSESRAAEELRELKTKYNDALRSKTQVLNEKQSVEYDNLTKQKMISDLTKKTHESQMEKLRLESELKALKAQAAQNASK